MATQPANIIPPGARKAEIVASLDEYTGRDLVALPPGDPEALGANIGVGDTNLDRVIRPWINRRYLVPDGKPRLPPKSITGKTTFAALLKLAGAN